MSPQTVQQDGVYDGHCCAASDAWTGPSDMRIRTENRDAAPSQAQPSHADLECACGDKQLGATAEDSDLESRAKA